MHLCLDGVFGFALRLSRTVFEVMRFDLMIKRGLGEQPQASGRKRSMKYCAGLDVSVNERPFASWMKKAEFAER
jgi:hypothetical protein